MSYFIVSIYSAGLFNLYYGTKIVIGSILGDDKYKFK